MIGSPGLNPTVRICQTNILPSPMHRFRLIRGSSRQTPVPLSKQIKIQILKDVWLRRNRRGFDPRWLFFDAPPSAELSKLLERHNIAYVTYE